MASQVFRSSAERLILRDTIGVGHNLSLDF